MSDRWDNPELSDTVTKGNLARDAMDAGEEIDDLADEMHDAMGPMTDEEKAEAEAGAAKARQLAAERGPDHHGFGNPPDRED
jgi:hypothetical protein